MVDVLTFDQGERPAESDRLEGYPHPREVLWYGGDPKPEAALLTAWQAQKLHHAWMLTGPEGIGKATLAYRFARFLLVNPRPDMSGSPQTLAVPADHPATLQLAQLVHPDVAVLRRTLNKEGKQFKTEIGVDDVRDALGLFRTTAGAGGWRIVIVDALDDMNRAAQNALLKMLEEPPAQAIFLLVAHNPGLALPTIRSRCRMLRIPPLSEDQVAGVLHRLAPLAGELAAEAIRHADGRARAALQWIDPSLASFREEVANILKAPAMTNSRALMRLLDKVTGRAGEGAFEALTQMIERHLHADLRDTTLSAAALAARAELWEKLRRSIRESETYNLDRRPLFLSLFSDLAALQSRPQGNPSHGA